MGESIPLYATDREFRMAPGVSRRCKGQVYIQEAERGVMVKGGRANDRESGTYRHGRRLSRNPVASSWALSDVLLSLCRTLPAPRRIAN